MEELTKNINNVERVPVWLRLVIFICMTPILLVLMPFFMLVIAIGVEIGIVVMMVEFLFTGKSKTDMEVKFGNENEKKQN